MRILLGSSSFGFGPVSKLTAISRALRGHHRVLTGTSVEAGFAQRNADAFDEVVCGDPPEIPVDRLIHGADHVVSVMDADLVFRAVAAGRPVVYVDSLLAFWQLSVAPERIAELCDRVRRDGFASVERHLGGLSPHERQYAAHLVADQSVVQNFPGVPERLARMRRLGSRQVHLTGSIVDEPTLADVAAQPGDGPDLLLSLGGFKNFLLDFDHNNQYLRLFTRWVPDVQADWPEFRQVLVCGGGFADGRGISVRRGGRSARFGCLGQPAFMRAVASARHYMLTPGLTAIHEATLLGRFPMALPEEHFGHIANLAGLRGTLFEKHGSRFSDLIADYDVPEHDYHGTAAIIAQIGSLLEDEDAYARFRRGMNERIEAFIALDAPTGAAGVAQLRALFQGPSFAQVLGALLPTAMGASAGAA